MLLVLTVISFGTALFFGSLAWRVTHEQRERSAARIAVLGTVIDAGIAPQAPVHIAALFAERPADYVEGQPRFKAWVAVAMGVLVLAVAALQWPAGSAAHQPLRAAAPAAVAPLELMSMQHAREGTALTITGLVRNPAAGAPVGRLSAVVLAFDRSGTFVTSNGAPIDFLTLAPGDESPFTVTVPRASEVVRYRVTFRTGDGVVRHIDRRNEGARLAAASRQ